MPWNGCTCKIGPVAGIPNIVGISFHYFNTRFAVRMIKSKDNDWWEINLSQIIIIYTSFIGEIYSDNGCTGAF